MQVLITTGKGLLADKIFCYHMHIILACILVTHQKATIHFQFYNYGKKGQERKVPVLFIERKKDVQYSFVCFPFITFADRQSNFPTLPQIISDTRADT